MYYDSAPVENERETKRYKTQELINSSKISTKEQLKMLENEEDYRYKIYIRDIPDSFSKVSLNGLTFQFNITFVLTDDQKSSNVIDYASCVDSNYLIEDKVINNILMLFAKYGNYKSFKRFFDKNKIYKNDLDNKGNDLWFYINLGGNEDIKRLVDYDHINETLNKENKNEYLKYLKQDEDALLYAAYNNFKNIVKLLVNEDYDVNARDEDGRTPFILACLSPNYETISILDILLDNGADINAKDNDKNNALMWNLYGNDINVFDFLINNGIEIYYPYNIDGDYFPDPFFTNRNYGSNSDYKEEVMLKKLLEQGVVIDSSEIEERMKRHVCKGREKLCDELIE